jgi:arylsulfatase A-like enzyme
VLRRILNSRWTYYGPAAALAILAVLSQFELKLPSRPQGGVEELRELRERKDTNLVFVLVDTLRADRLSTYGYERETSPALTELARRGVRFAHVESQSSWTKASMASMWTSLYPMRSGVMQVEDTLPEQVELPAERLKAAGFTTAGLYRNGWVGRNFGFHQGFDAYIRPDLKEDPLQLDLARGNPAVGTVTGTDGALTDSAIEFLQAHQSQRFFLYLHYMDVHQYVFDQAAADLGFGNRLSDAYDSSIRWVDGNVGRLVQELEDRGLLKRTIVVVASDHGEGFTEHGEGHARTLYREVTEVPWILALPIRFQKDVVVDSMVRNVDIWPTLYDLLGLEPPRYTDGRSTVPLIEAAVEGRPAQPADNGSARAVGYLDRTWGNREEPPKPTVSITGGGKRFVYRASDDVELFDHETDPWEQRNLAPQRKDEVTHLRSEAEELLAEKPAYGEAPKIEIDEMYLEQLRALGYVVK